MTETIKVEVEEQLAKRFRKKAMERYGYKKGSMKKALENLMQEFAGEQEDSEAKPNWEALRGIWKDEYKGMTSVQLQHSIWRIKNDYHSDRHKRLR